MKLSFTDHPSSSVFDQDYSNYFYYTEDNNYWICIELINWIDSVGEREAKEIGFKYCVTVKELYVDLTSLKKIESALESMGALDQDASELTPKELIYALFNYGCGDQVSSENGNNFKKLLTEARQSL